MLISVDVESDGPVPGLYSMVSFGAVVVEPGLNRTFHGQVAPISTKWDPKALAISNISREAHLAYPPPRFTMNEFTNWLGELGSSHHTLITDNPAFDFAFINYYFHAYIGRNPFGYSARRIGDLWAGFMEDASKTSDWKKHRITKHTHNPVDDAKGNAEALLYMKSVGLKIKDIPDE